MGSIALTLAHLVAVVAALVGLLQSPATTGALALNYYDYLDLQTGTQLESSQALKILEALKALHKELGHNSSPDVIAEAIGRKLESSDVDGAHRRVYEHLASMWNGIDLCSQPLVDQTKYIVALMREKVEPALTFKPFMKHFGGKKFGLCSRRPSEFYKLKLGLPLEPVLDECFLAAAGLAGKFQDSEKYRVFQGLDLTTSKLDVKKMVKVARKALKHEAIQAGDSALVIRFLSSSCSKLNAVLGPSFDRFNLARVLGARETSQDETFLKMNESHRLCLSLLEKGTRCEVEANIKGSASDVGTSWLQMLTCRSPDAI